jgi:hypothetical protein
MAFASGRKLKSGLDYGPESKGRRADDKETTETTAVLEIKPGERLAEYSARVDAALPLSGLTAKGGRDPAGLKKFRTRKEKKMHRLYDQWREEERIIKDKKEEQEELAAQRELDEETVGAGSVLGWLDTEEGTKRRGKKGKRRGAADEEDPWLEVKKRRAEAKVGLHDVALAPPELHRPKSGKRLTVHGASVNAGNVPKSAGSLRRREELNEVRQDIVTAYRHIRNRSQQQVRGGT